MDTNSYYMNSSNGKIKYWGISVKDNSITTSYGYYGGKIQTCEKSIKGVNIGKSNETTDNQQALLHAKTLIKKKIAEGYSQKISELGVYENVLPMLAHDFNKRYSSIKYPCYVQPKLDGIRMTIHMKNDKIIYLSRTGKLLENMNFLSNQLINMFKNYDVYLDGEIYLNGVAFQDIVSLTKKKQINTESLEYHVYDIYTKDNMKYSDRLNILKNIFDNYSNVFKNIKKVSTYIVDKEFEIDLYHDKFVDNGYEGIIIRNMAGEYKCNYRSCDLQKYKKFEDCEYKIIDAISGVGKLEGCVIWKCEINNDVFNVKQSGSIENLKYMWDNRNNYIGKYLTVKYQGKTSKGIPRFPIGVCIRDYE